MALKYRFDGSEYTLDEAAEWLADHHDFKDYLVDYTLDSCEDDGPSEAEWMIEWVYNFTVMETVDGKPPSLWKVRKEFFKKRLEDSCCDPGEVFMQMECLGDDEESE